MARPPKKDSEKFSHIEKTPMNLATEARLQKQADLLTGGNKSALSRSRVDDPYRAEIICLINEIARVTKLLRDPSIQAIGKSEAVHDLQELSKYGLELLSHDRKR